MSDPAGTVSTTLVTNFGAFSTTGAVGTRSINGNYQQVGANSSMRLTVRGLEVAQPDITGNVTLDGAIVADFARVEDVVVRRTDSYVAVVYGGARTGTFVNAIVGIAGLNFDVTYDDANKRVKFLGPDFGVVAGVNVVAPLGNALAAGFGTFSDPDAPGYGPSDYTVTINWGDGATGTGVLTGSAGSYTVSAVSGHTYASSGTYHASFTVTDNLSGLSSSANFDAIIDAPPTAIALSNSSIAENNSPHAVVGALSTTDATVGDTFTYSLVSGTVDADNASFALAGNDLKLIPSANYEVKSSYSVRVRSTDAVGLWTEQNFTISITDVYEPPVTIAGFTFQSSAPTTAGPHSAEVGSGSVSQVHASSSTVYSNPVGNGNSESFSSNRWQVGDYFLISISTIGFQNLSITWDQAGSSTGPRDFDIEYAVGGGSFTSFGSYNVSLSNWSSTTHRNGFDHTYDLSSVDALENQSTILIRLICTSTSSIGGGTVGTAGTSRIDDLFITGFTI